MVGRALPAPHLLVVGHLTEDRLASGPRLGGAAAYAGLLAARFGVRTRILTAADPDFPFAVEGCREIRIPSPTRTVFENRYRDGERRQRLLGVASPIPEARIREALAALPPGGSVLYAPVASELDGAWAFPRPRRGLAGALPQGLLRVAGPDGRVRLRRPAGLPARLAGLDLVVLSRSEAFPLDAGAVAITDGKRGATLRSGGEELRIPAVPAVERDPTGAGDVFGTALMIGLMEGRPLAAAGRLAAAAAALAVEADGTAGVPDRRAAEERAAVS